MADQRIGEIYFIFIGARMSLFSVVLVNTMALKTLLHIIYNRFKTHNLREVNKV